MRRAISSASLQWRAHFDRVERRRAADELEASVIGAFGQLLQQARRTGQPAARGGRVRQPDRVLVREPDRNVRGCPGVAGPAEARVRARALDDRCRRTLDPPQRTSEAVAGLRRVRDRERALERRAGDVPLGRGERRLADREGVDSELRHGASVSPGASGRYSGA